ncbi:MAG: hypothetical protein AB7W16_00165 [Candidatus Obscuribacterales bacterium]
MRDFLKSVFLAAFLGALLAVIATGSLSLSQQIPPLRAGLAGAFFAILGSAPTCGLIAFLGIFGLRGIKRCAPPLLAFNLPALELTRQIASQPEILLAGSGIDPATVPDFISRAPAGIVAVVTAPFILGTVAAASIYYFADRASAKEDT